MDPASAAPRPGEVRGRPPRIYCFIRSNGSGNIPRGGERDGERAAKTRGGKWQSQPTKPSRVKLIREDGGGAGAGAGSAPPAPRARSSAQGGRGSAAPRRASGRGAVCKRAPAKSCSKNDKPSGKWTHGAARMYFFIFDNLCPKETILKIIEMITIHCCLTLSRSSQIMKS